MAARGGSGLSGGSGGSMGDRLAARVMNAGGAAPGGACGIGAEGASGGAVTDGAGCCSVNCARRFLANCPMICAAVDWIMPTPRPYCATAPDSVRSVCTSTLEPVPAGSSRNVAAALAPPRPLASVPCALTRAL